jgi:hypothetical protein
VVAAVGVSGLLAAAGIAFWCWRVRQIQPRSALKGTVAERTGELSANDQLETLNAIVRINEQRLRRAAAGHLRECR